MNDPKKRGIALLVLGSLGLGAYYLLKDDFDELLKNIHPSKKVQVVEKENEPWSAMTWKTLGHLLGSRCKEGNLLETYYMMNEDEKMQWRMAVYKEAKTSLDRAFVYLDSKILSQVYSSLRDLDMAVKRYSKNEISFPELYASYKKALQEIFGLR